MPASDNYSTELTQLREGLASEHVTVESNGRRVTYRGVDEIRKAIDYFEGLGGKRRKRRTRYKAASLGRY